MPDVLRLITPPLPVTRGLAPPEVSAAVAADALARRAWSRGRAASVDLQSLTGDLSGRLALDRELTRLGHDTASVPPDVLAEISSALDAARRDTAEELLERVGVSATISSEGTASPAGRYAAVVAFVRLHEAGFITCDDVVVPYCPSCATVIEGPDAVPGTSAAPALTVHVQLDEGSSLDVVTTTPELLGAAVAVAVPAGHPAAARGARARLPFRRREVPVVEEVGGVEPRLLLPAHDPLDFELAQLLDLPARSAIGRNGLVTRRPLRDQPRYAARQAATSMLSETGRLANIDEDGQEPVVRCRQCGSVAVVLLEQHWILRVAEIEVAVADAIRHDAVRFVPADVRESVLLAAGGPPWCLDRSVAGGVPIPVHSCQDCGRVFVTVDVGSSCRACFGETTAAAATIDGRFVAALAPLAKAGWPGRISADAYDASKRTVAVVPAGAVAEWALPALALGLHLAGALPFTTVVVHHQQGPVPPIDLDALPDTTGGADDLRAVRLALLAEVAVDEAGAAIEALDDPVTPSLDPDVVDETAAAIEAIEGAAALLDELAPQRAAAMLVSTLSAGVPVTAAPRARSLTVPFLGG